MWARIDRIVYSATRDDAAAAGFDDARFYRELSARPEERSVHMVRIGLTTAAQPFVAWATLEGRQRY
jgi:guanine deaminase